jgi:hypothetical protein
VDLSPAGNSTLDAVPVVVVRHLEGEAAREIRTLRSGTDE